MKILQLVNRIPYPLHDGGNLAVHAVTEGFLQAGVSLSMLAMNTTRHWVDVHQLPEMYGRLKHFKTVKVDNRVRPVAAFLNLFTGSSYNVERFISEGYRQTLIGLLQQEDFDIIHIESLFLLPYVATIRQYSKARISLRSHNIEYQIWERLATQASNPLKKWYLSLLARRLKKFELAHLNDCDIILSISPQDEAIFKKLGTIQPLFLHPFGIKTDHIPFVPASTPPVSLYHIGAMDWLPNVESVNWLLEKVMPLIEEQLSETVLHLAGRNMPDHYREMNRKNVKIWGEVPDAAAFERDKSILVVPLLSGGGVRIKILQAMAMGKTVITTSIGLQGIEAKDGRDVLVADTPEDFSRKIIETIQNPERIEAIGAAARKLISKKYDRTLLIHGLLERYQELIGAK
jgi:glycosyltransferase involved in cell wall biosynthesis